MALTVQYRHEITSETERFEIGRTYGREDENAPWEFRTTFMRYKPDLWFVGPPHEILARLGLSVEERRARELADLFDGDLAGFYYVSEAAGDTGGDEAIKWIMGALAAHLNASKIPFTRVATVLPADYLAAFVTALQRGAFDRSFAKDVFAALLAAPRFETPENYENPDDFVLTADIADSFVEGVGGVEGLDALLPVDPEFRIPAAEVVARIAARPEFKLADTSEIDSIIDEVVAANPEQAAKVAAQPKLLMWFTGQVMRAAKGKAAAPVVTEKLKARFGV